MSIEFISCDLSSATFSYLSSGSNPERTGYEADNLRNYDPESRWASANTGSGESVVVDFGASRTASRVVIEGHNFDARGTDTITLETASNAGFTTGVGTVATLTPASASAYKVDFAPVTSRYWRVLISGSVGWEPYLGNLFVAWPSPISQSLVDEQVITQPFSDSLSKTSIDGTARGSIGVARTRYRTAFNLRFLNETEFAIFRAFVAAVRGGAVPFYYVNEDGEIAYSRLEIPNSPSKVSRFNQGDVEVRLVSSRGSVSTAVVSIEVAETFDWID